MMQLRSDSGQIFQTRMTSTGATTAKVPHVFNGKVWFPLNTALANDKNEFVFQSEASGAAKATGEAWTPGGSLYWNDTTKVFTTTAGGNTLCGKAIQPALSGDTVSPIILFNTFAAA